MASCTVNVTSLVPEGSSAGCSTTTRSVWPCFSRAAAKSPGPSLGWLHWIHPTGFSFHLLEGLVSSAHFHLRSAPAGYSTSRHFLSANPVCVCSCCWRDEDDALASPSSCPFREVRATMLLLLAGKSAACQLPVLGPGQVSTLTTASGQSSEASRGLSVSGELVFSSGP